MPRMTAPNGATVSVADEKVDRLSAQGYTLVAEPKKAPAKKATSSRASK